MSFWRNQLVMRNRVQPQCFEPLESRRHLSATLDAGVVTVVGTNKGDSIVVNLNADASMLAVWENGVKTEFTLTEVTKLEIRSGNGNDTIDVKTDNGAVSVPMVVLAGNGNDKITGGDGNDVLNGGNGKDTIYGMSGDDRLIGNNGNDVLYGGAGDDQMIGGNGKDFVFGMDGRDTFNTADGDNELRDRADDEVKELLAAM